MASRNCLALHGSSDAAGGLRVSWTVGLTAGGCDSFATAGAFVFELLAVDVPTMAPPSPVASVSLEANFFNLDDRRKWYTSLSYTVASVLTPIHSQKKEDNDHLVTHHQ